MRDLAIFARRRAVKAEQAKYERACDAVAQGLAGEMTPLERSRASAPLRRNPYQCNPTHHNRTPMKMPFCPAKQFATHPDAKVRYLAEQQAAEQHALNDYLIHGQVHEGKCSAKRCRPTRTSLPLSLFAKNDHTMRIALGMKRQARIKARGW